MDLDEELIWPTCGFQVHRERVGSKSRPVGIAGQLVSRIWKQRISVRTKKAVYGTETLESGFYETACDKQL